MNRPTGVKPAAETVADIRMECEAMSNRTPCATFHLVATPNQSILVRQCLKKIPIDHIDVSISATGFQVLGTSTGNDVPHPAVHTTTSVTNDYRQLDMV
jgi:hypothetical protein